MNKEREDYLRSKLYDDLSLHQFDIGDAAHILDYLLVTIAEEVKSSNNILLDELIEEGDKGGETALINLIIKKRTS